MKFDFETLQNEWEKDTKINPDELHNESLKIPILHAKYFKYYNDILVLRKRADKVRKVLRLEKYEYYTGKADPEVYVKKPFPKKIRDKETLQKYMEADEDLMKVDYKVECYDIMLNYIDSILKMILQRNYQIKNSIDYTKFIAGFG
jgi:hypothetical protein